MNKKRIILSLLISFLFSVIFTIALFSSLIVALGATIEGNIFLIYGLTIIFLFIMSFIFSISFPGTYKFVRQYAPQIEKYALTKSGRDGIITAILSFFIFTSVFIAAGIVLGLLGIYYKHKNNKNISEMKLDILSIIIALFSLLLILLTGYNILGWWLNI